MENILNRVVDSLNRNELLGLQKLIINKLIAIDSKHKIKLSEEDMTVRLRNCLTRAKFEYLEELIKFSVTDIVKLKNFGRRSLRELIELLDEHNLELKDKKLK